MKRIATYIAAGLLVVGAQALMAQSTTTNSAPATPGDHQGATPAQRKERMGAILKIVGLTPADLKGLSHEDRQAKIKDAVDKTVADLKAKEANGTLTDQEQTDLKKLQKFLAHARKNAETPSAVPPTAPPSAPPNN